MRILPFDLTTAVCLGLAALFVRQFGHAVLEPDAHEKEMSLLGFNTRNKTLIVAGYLLIPVAHMVQARSLQYGVFVDRLPAIAEHWWFWTQLVIVGRVAFLDLEVQLPDVDDLVGQARHRSHHRRHHLLPAPSACLTSRRFLWVAALLSLERLTYAAVWRAPNAFRRWSARHARQQSPIDTLAVLFVGFKVLQAAVFVGWCLDSRATATCGRIPRTYRYSPAACCSSPPASC